MWSLACHCASVRVENCFSAASHHSTSRGLGTLQGTGTLSATTMKYEHMYANVCHVPEGESI